jgi:peptide/nickel transport system substrate-binding protein
MFRGINRSKKGLLVTGGLVLSLVASACSPQPQSAPNAAPSSASGSAPAAKTDCLTIGLNREIVSMDSKAHQYDALLPVQWSVHEALTGLAPDMSVAPKLAEKFENTSPTEWKVTLRNGAKYSDGTPVKVEDVQKAIESYRDFPGFDFRSQFPEFPTVQKIDDRTFTLKTQKPVPNLDRIMMYIVIVPAAQNKAGDSDDAIGTGPYKVVKFDKGAQTVELESNPNYYGEAPKIKCVKTRFFAEESVRIAALKAGEIDVAGSIAPDAAAQLATDPNLTVDRSPGVRLAQLFYNFRKPANSPLANPKVREALTYAIDGQSITKNILQDTVTPLKGLIPSALKGAVETGEYKYDPAKAKALLKEAGYENGFPVTIIWEKGEFMNAAQVMETVASMLQAVGVKATLKEFESGGDIGKWRRGETGDWDILGNGYGNPTGDGFSPLQGIFGGTPELEKTRDSYHGYVVKDVYEKVGAASLEFGEKRLQLMGEAQKLAWATWPQIWGFTQNNITAYRKNMKGIEVLPTNVFELRKVSK